MRTRSLLFPLLVWILAQAPIRPALAFDIEFIPDSHHQQFQTFAFFPDNDHTSILWRNASRAWGGLGGAIALLGSEEYRTQFVAYGSANAAMRLNSRGDTLLTDTVDARVGIEFEYAMTEVTRLTLGWTHFSGHISDDVPDADLIGSNLGDEWIHLRVIHDIPGLSRLGATLKPVVGSDPGMKAFGADQFVEVYPWGVTSDIRKGTPYLALGLEEYGPLEIDATFHAQAGLFFGDHLSPKHTQQIRFALGFYTGDDPRLKYMQFKYSKVTFGYAEHWSISKSLPIFVKSVILNMFKNRGFMKQAGEPQDLSKRQRTRQAIVEKASRLFQKNGYDAVTMRSLAQSCELSLGAFYYHFKCKEELVLELYQASFQGQRERTRKFLGQGKPSLDEAMLWVCKDRFKEFSSRRDLLRVLAQRIDPQDPISPWHVSSRAIRERSVDLFEEVTSRSLHVDRKTRRLIARGLWLQHLALLGFWLFDRSPGERETAGILKHSVQLWKVLPSLLRIPGSGKVLTLLLEPLARLEREAA